MLNNEVIRIAKEIGIETVGFSSLTETKASFAYAITLVIPLLNGVINEIDNSPTYSYYAHYRQVNKFIDEATLKISMFLEKEGYLALPIKSSQSIGLKEEYSSVFPHKTAATLSGLGFIGKSGLFISEKYGAKCRLGTILTSAPFKVGQPIKEGKCGSCQICAKACPSSAIYGIMWNRKINREELYDAKACSDFMKSHFSNIGRGEVCGICMKVCPYGGKQK